MRSGMDTTAQTATPTTRGRTISARLPLWVLIGAFLGILVGVTFGERASLLKPLGGSAAAIYVLPAAERQHADPIPEHLAVIAGEQGVLYRAAAYWISQCASRGR